MLDAGIIAPSKQTCFSSEISCYCSQKEHTPQRVLGMIPSIVLITAL
jgi:hypothetical protein